MFDTHERILQRLHDTGLKEFSTEMIKGIIDKVEDEEIDRMYEDWLKYQEAEAQERQQWRADEITLDRIERSQQEAESQPVSWQEATVDLDGFPELHDNHDMGIER